MTNELSVLLTNITMAGRSGTVSIIRDLALKLLSRGHKPIVYSPQWGETADFLRSRAVAVLSDIGLMRTAPQIIHGHHNTTTVTAMARFPAAPAIFWCHDFVSWYDVPPLLPAIRRYVAVDETVTRDRLITEGGVSPARVRLSLNAVDLERFRPRGDLPERLQRALAFAKNAQHLDAIRGACATAGVALDLAGVGTGMIVDRPEDLLPRYDLVFSSALSALEAMACGCAVIVCDGRGLAGMVTAARLEQWRRLNFGLRTMTRPVTASALLAEIRSYDAADAAEVCRRIRAGADLERRVDDLVALYREVIEEHRAAPPIEAEEAATALASYFQRWLPQADARWPPAAERDPLIARLDKLETALGDWRGRARAIVGSELGRLQDRLRSLLRRTVTRRRAKLD